MATLKLRFEKEHKSVIQYEAEEEPAGPKPFLQTIYVRRFALPVKIPQTITLTLEY